MKFQAEGDEPRAVGAGRQQQDSAGMWEEVEEARGLPWATRKSDQQSWGPRKNLDHGSSPHRVMQSPVGLLAAESYCV